MCLDCLILEEQSRGSMDLQREIGWLWVWVLGVIDIIRNNDTIESVKRKQNQELLAGDIARALLSSSEG